MLSKIKAKSQEKTKKTFFLLLFVWSLRGNKGSRFAKTKTGWCPAWLSGQALWGYVFHLWEFIWIPLGQSNLQLGSPLRLPFPSAGSGPFSSLVSLPNHHGMLGNGAWTSFSLVLSFGSFLLAHCSTLSEKSLSCKESHHPYCWTQKWTGPHCKYWLLFLPLLCCHLYTFKR